MNDLGKMLFDLGVQMNRIASAQINGTMEEQAGITIEELKRDREWDTPKQEKENGRI